jgi:ABC-type multidrug transport system fused ATPase/permease subunit
MVAKRIEEPIQAYNEAVGNVSSVRLNSEWVPRWISASIFSFLILYGGGRVANEQLRIGTYLALLRLTSITGDSFTEAYKSYLIMFDVFLPMWRIRRFINIATDLGKRKAANRIRRKRGEEMRTTVRQLLTKEDLQKGVPVVDLLPIMLEDVAFRFTDGDPYLFQGVHRTIRQGRLVGIMGQPATGMGTFLELLGGVHEQDVGNIFVPPHLRVLHVSRTPIVLQGTLADNIFFGVTGMGQVKDLDPSVHDRGVKICERLGFPKRLMKMLQEANVDISASRRLSSVRKGHRHGALSRSDKKLIHLARGLIYNPEVLIVHTPGMYFDKESRARVMTLLSEFVERRGVEMDDATRLRRRPRTCIFSTYDYADCYFADETLQFRNNTLVDEMELVAAMTKSDIGDLALRNLGQA